MEIDVIPEAYMGIDAVQEVSMEVGVMIEMERLGLGFSDVRLT
jgi:hypothetical protein